MPGPLFWAEPKGSEINEKLPPTCKYYFNLLSTKGLGLAVVTLNARATQLWIVWVDLCIQTLLLSPHGRRAAHHHTIRKLYSIQGSRNIQTHGFQRLTIQATVLLINLALATF